MPVTTYRSTDTSAPVLTGQAGTLITLLDACLVNGYGSKAAAGWSKAFTGTNTAAYRMATSGNTGFYLNVNDAAPGAAGAREARLRGYETMSAIDTGTGPFPTVSQAATGVFVRKSTTADATARAWTLIADDATFYLFTETGDVVSPVACCSAMFGDFESYTPGDLYNCALIARPYENKTGTAAFVDTANSTDSCNDVLFMGVGPAYSPNQLAKTIPGHYTARSYTQAGGSIGFGKHHDLFKANTILGSGANNPWYAFGGVGDGSVSFPYPNPADGGLYASPIWVHHSNAVRGALRGLWAPLHVTPLTHNDTFSGAGPLAGKTFLAQASNTFYRAFVSTNSQLFVETSNTWA